MKRGELPCPSRLVNKIMTFRRVIFVIGMVVLSGFARAAEEPETTAEFEFFEKKSVRFWSNSAMTATPPGPRPYGADSVSTTGRPCSAVATPVRFWSRQDRAPACCLRR
ncbi:MAG: hypothetical protein CMJ81_15575 [Planctomycetaceae bacterium]|nr:hypothetical protein [Planctomycetaceae bacterium]